ncbi:MAG: long-chain fatty acid--CoA ligase [Bacteroidota bacterium]
MWHHHDWAAKWAVYSPEKIAFKEYETSRALTFFELNKLANRLAHYLIQTCKLKKGDRVAILAENNLEYLVLFSVAQKTGLILVPVNYRLASTEIDYLLKNCEPRLIICEDKFLEKIKTGFVEKNIPYLLEINELKQICNKGKNTANDLFFDNMKIEVNDPVFILYTSGTTGFPKGALYTHKMLFWNSINTAMSLIVNTESRTVNCMPPFHTGGWNVLTTPFFHHGGYTCLMKKFDPVQVLQLIDSEQVTIFMGVPTMLGMMADLPAFEQTDFSSLKYIIVGGEPMPVPLIEKWDAKGVPIRQGYGMTEVGPNLTSLHQRDAIRKKGSIGRQNFYVQTKIIRPDGNETEINEAGELLLRGPMVTPGYWRNEEASKKAIKNNWFYTGDMVRQDEEGYLFIVDRIKNMFISGGENVYPAEIERVLIAHEKINEAAVIGVADKKWGEVGKAFIVKKENISETEIIDYCRTKMAKFKVPKYIEFLSELPKNDTGKIDRQELKK